MYVIGISHHIHKDVQQDARKYVASDCARRENVL